MSTARIAKKPAEKDDEIAWAQGAERCPPPARVRVVRRPSRAAARKRKCAATGLWRVCSAAPQALAAAQRRQTRWWPCRRASSPILRRLHLPRHRHRRRAAHRASCVGRQALVVGQNPLRLHLLRRLLRLLLQLLPPVPRQTPACKLRHPTPMRPTRRRRQHKRRGCRKVALSAGPPPSSGR